MTEELLAAMSPSETELLRIIWELGEGTVQQVLEQLPQNREIGYATVPRKRYLQPPAACRQDS